MPRYTIRQSGQLLSNYADTRAAIDRSIPWQLCRDSLAIGDYADAPAALVEALGELNKLPAPDAKENPTFAIAISADMSPRGTCVMSKPLGLGDYRPVVSRGEIEIAVGAGMGEELVGVSILVGDIAAPTLATYLHRRYSTQPAERPAPPAPPTPDEIAARELARQKADIIRAVAKIVWQSEREVDRAAHLLAVLDKWQALQ